MVEKPIKCGNCRGYIDDYREATCIDDELICRECYVKSEGITIEELEKREAEERRKWDKEDMKQRKSIREARDWWNSQVPTEKNWLLVDAHKRYLKKQAEEDVWTWKGEKRYITWWSLFCGICVLLTVVGPPLLNPNILFWISCQWVTLLILLFYYSYAKQWDGKRKRRKLIGRSKHSKQDKQSHHESL